ncbi:ABC transporter ATP-binding protein [Abyssisolibacter fermentans]|uniref:ABC transporter ATP-binding protein n=1 Tax=Abyssisolibacter fermentans TaxID=1766203 RepID=UPI00082B338E|nr:ATP-binding cassette domain-containing protein [Abyssisolibacter fermentans]
MANVTLDKITKKYLVNNQVISVLNGISYTFEDKTITVILGKSGCGKTTLLRLIANLEMPTEGNIHIQGTNSKIGTVFQESRLMPWLNVEDNIMFSLDHKDTSLIQKYLDIMGLNNFRKAYPNQISGGMAQRTSIARTLAYNPEVMLMDEPFAALDYFTRKKLQHELLSIYEIYKRTIVFITHNVEEALLLGHKILILNKGKISKEYDLTQYTYPRDMVSKSLLNLKEDIINTISKH